LAKGGQAAGPDAGQTLGGMEHYSIAVIGSGSGGAEAALAAAEQKQRVLLVENEQIGGGALHFGTIPMRALMANERLFRQLGRLAGEEEEYGQELYQWANRQRKTIAQATERLHRRLKGQGVEMIHGHGVLLGGGRLRIDLSEGTSQEVRAQHIILATGARPREAERSWDGSAVATSRRFISLADPPGRLIVIGGGHIGCEFAVLFNAVGSKVTLIERATQLLPEMDVEAGEWFGKELERQGIEVIKGETARAVWGNTAGEYAVAHLTESGRELGADRILMACGRVPNVQGMGLDEAGVSYDPEAGIQVDCYLRTSVPEVWAIGDVNHLCTLADSAKVQARVAVQNIFGACLPFDAKAQPRCVHADPVVAAVGMTDAEARAGGLPVRTGRAAFRAPTLASGLAESRGFLKLVVAANTRRLLGATVVGESAHEWIDEFSTACHLGADIDQLASVPRFRTPIAEAIAECRSHLT